jgi:hypothetical protein
LEASAVKDALKGFIEDVPPTRASGSRTALSDEELRERASLGDVKAERMLSNRESARLSRKRKWDEWNDVRRQALSTEAACRALETVLRSASSSCMLAECASVTSETASIGHASPASNKRAHRGLSVVTAATDDGVSSAEEESDSDCASIGALPETSSSTALVHNTPLLQGASFQDDFLSPAGGVLKGWMLDCGFPVDSAEVDGM